MQIASDVLAADEALALLTARAQLNAVAERQVGVRFSLSIGRDPFSSSADRSAGQSSPCRPFSTPSP